MEGLLPLALIFFTQHAETPYMGNQNDYENVNPIKTPQQLSPLGAAVVFLSGAKKCTLESELVSNDLIKGEYSCPGDKYPEAFTECCGEGDCCVLNDSTMTDEWLLRIISLTVITTCLCLAAVLLVCCFWARCPLYTACRANYNSSDVAMYAYAHEDDPLCLMPKESNGSARYTPCKVTTRKLDDV